MVFWESQEDFRKDAIALAREEVLPLGLLIGCLLAGLVLGMTILVLSSHPMQLLRPLRNEEIAEMVAVD